MHTWPMTTSTSQWGWYMLLSEHVYCVATAFKMTEGVEQWICIKYYLRNEHFFVETTRMIQKAAAMDNWWLAAPSQQYTCSCIMSRAEIFGKTSNHPGDSAPCSPDLVPCDSWLFPKLKSLLKGKRFQTIHEIQENTMRQLMVPGTVWGPKVPIIKGTEVLLSYVRYFLYIVSSSINVSTFHITWLDTFWTDLVWNHQSFN